MPPAPDNIQLPAAVGSHWRGQGWSCPALPSLEARRIPTQAYSHLCRQGPLGDTLNGSGLWSPWKRRKGGQGCYKLCVNQEHIHLPSTGKHSWLSGLRVDESPGHRDGSFPTLQAPGLPEANWAAASVLFSFSLFQFYVFKNRVGSWKGLKGFSQQFP